MQRYIFDCLLNMNAYTDLKLIMICIGNMALKL